MSSGPSGLRPPGGAVLNFGAAALPLEKRISTPLGTASGGQAVPSKGRASVMLPVGWRLDGTSNTSSEACHARNDIR